MASVQELSYTKYGPDGVHRALQAAWTRSPDSTYFQPSPDNKLYTFANGQLKRYENTYPLVVALSDLSQHGRPTAWISIRHYVGRIDDSLFALGHVNYPLVIFTPPDKRGNVPRIDDGGKTIPDPQETNATVWTATSVEASMPAARSSLSRLITDGEDHDIACTNQMCRARTSTRSRIPVSVSLPNQDIDRNRGADAYDDSQFVEHSVPSSIPGREEDKVPEATPSHRTVLARLAGEWIAAWAGAGTVLLSTLVFGFGLVSKSKSVKEIKEDGARTPVPDENSKTQPVCDHSRFKTCSATQGSSGAQGQADSASGSSGPAEFGECACLPAGNPGMLAETNGTSSAMEIARMITDETSGRTIAIPVEPTEMTTAAEETELETTGKKRVRRGRRGGKGRDKNRSKSGDIGVVDRPDTLVVEKAVVTPALSSLVVTEDVLGYGSQGRSIQGSVPRSIGRC
ncbi:Serine/threonine-protein kinase [Ceratobasidium sp. AG-Ba]|nr:Serine/threonine-protein kinase [Ceratobasidium sp. AG-Ba]